MSNKTPNVILQLISRNAPNTEVCHMDWRELWYLLPTHSDEGAVKMGEFRYENDEYLNVKTISKNLSKKLNNIM